MEFSRYKNDTAATVINEHNVVICDLWYVPFCSIGLLHKSRCCHFSPSNIPTLVVYTMYQGKPTGPFFSP